MPDLALFDFDGTLTSDDSFTRFVFHAVPPLRLTAGKLVLAPFVAAYKAGRYPATRLRAKMCWLGFKGRVEAELRAVGQAFASEIIPTFLRPEAMERFHWHKQRGDTIAIVSASLDLYLAPWCLTHGVDLLCTQVEVANGRITGRYRGGDCTAAEKARRVTARFDVKAFAAVHAYGDTPEDDELLALGTHRWYRGRQITGGTDHAP